MKQPAGIRCVRSDYERMEVVVLSTAHLTQEEAEREPGAWPSYCLEGEYGFVAYIGEPGDLHIDAEAWPGLCAVARAIHAEVPGVAWVRFDRDGDVHKRLPTFEW